MMNYPRSLFCRPPKPQFPQSRAATFSSSVLSTVPMEILLYITDILPPESEVALSLTCKQLKYVLGNQHFLRLNASTEHTLALLELLALDLPNQIACSACRRLHSMENFHRYNPAMYPTEPFYYYGLQAPACVLRDKNNNISDISNLFGETAFKMAIKRYHQQPDCRKILDIMSSKVTKEVKRTKKGNYDGLVREECRVIQGRLMHRLQSVHILQNSLTTTPSGGDQPHENICPHIWTRAGRKARDSGLKRCQSCCTEFRIHVKHYDGHGFATFFTRWKDFGAKPENEEWTQHRLDPFIWDLRQMSQDQDLVRSPTQEENLSSAFGDTHDFGFDWMLTLDNKAELFEFQRNKF